MFAVDDVLVSDGVLDAPFACHLGRCRGACCVQGEHGAPLEPEECAELEAALPVVWARLRPEAQATIERQGPWVEESPGEYATACVDGEACVFVVYERGIARCVLQQAHQEGRLAFEKPISCHLYPLRVERWGDVTVLNYEQIPLCRPAVRHGRRLGVFLHDFLEAPLVRRFGADWYARFRAACLARAEALAAARPPSPR